MIKMHSHEAGGDPNRCYRSLLARSQLMLDLASAQYWDALIHESMGYVAQMEAVLETYPPGGGEFAARRERRELIASILANDAEIRNRLRLRREELQGLMRHTDVSKRAGLAYQSFQE